MDERIKAYETKMSKSYDSLLKDFSTIRAGRANPHVLDKITVDYYGTPTPLQQVGNITVPEARILMIQPWEKKMIREIEKAIMVSDIGINPTNDGTCIRLVFPELTEGNSTFEIPVDGFDYPMEVVGDTVAMSEPHESEYTLQFDSSTMEKAE